MRYNKKIVFIEIEDDKSPTDLSQYAIEEKYIKKPHKNRTVDLVLMLHLILVVCQITHMQ
jgi:hypothetical protein